MLKFYIVPEKNAKNCRVYFLCRTLYNCLRQRSYVMHFVCLLLICLIAHLATLLVYSAIQLSGLQIKLSSVELICYLLSNSQHSLRLRRPYS